MSQEIIGRSVEKIALLERLSSQNPELVAVYGRRRVGKTFLIRNIFEGHIIFELTGLHNATVNEQLLHFTNTLQNFAGKKYSPPANWLLAFWMLEKYIATIKTKKKKVIFFDEFPWLSGRKSGFLTAFSNFWNSWAEMHPNILVVICGSAASWMVQKVVNDRGGLHNRITLRLRLEPFSLRETRDFLAYKNVKLNQYQILKLYMVMGGIPHYLNAIDKTQSADQNIQRICFSKDGLLTDEYHNLFVSLFDKAERHEAIMKVLAKKPKGLSREEILKAVKLSTGGAITKVFKELEESGFITFQSPFNRIYQNGIYRINDEYCLFYIKYIEPNSTGNSAWSKILQQPSFTSWCGLAFESVCLKQVHIGNLLAALGISGIHCEISNWRIPGSTGTQGAQIDIVIDRGDGCINLCELKYSKNVFKIDKNYADSLQNKVWAFQRITKTRKIVFLTFITTFGIEKNVYANSMVTHSLTIEALFMQPYVAI